MTRRLNIKTVVDIDLAIRSGLEQIPNDIELVVGIPRSGMLPATLISTYLNVRLSDLDGLLQQRAFRTGERPISSTGRGGRILVVDDSIHSGNSMRNANSLIAKAGIDATRVITLAVFGLEKQYPACDIVLEVVPAPRIFSWNITNSWVLNHACVDFDGVLCRNPTHEENDDGDKYRQFIKTATPLYLPACPIKYIVTSRLEKYRKISEDWLMNHGVKYEKLLMVDLESAELRTEKYGFCHAKNKANVFSKLSEAIIFIESETWQAKLIARLSKKTSFSVGTGEVFYPPYSSHFGRQALRAVRNPLWAIKRLIQKLKRD